MSILNEIFESVKVEVEQRQRATPLQVVRSLAEAAAPANDFIAAMQKQPHPALIAEVKRASPSRGVMNELADPTQLAELYFVNGARAISILTEESHFHGRLDDLSQVRRKFPRVPLLCKDFIYHPYQVYEARSVGADALLLIAAFLDKGILADLHTLIHEVAMAALVEVHTLQELEKALSVQPRLVGINNRNLHSFETDLKTTYRLMPFMPQGVTVISESGIKEAGDIQGLGRVGVNAVLVGEALVTAADPAAKVRQLAGITSPAHLKVGSRNA